MQIKKVSKYIPVSTPSRSHEGSTVRQMLISIPRLEWLDKDIDASTHYRKYKDISEVKPKTPNEAKNTPSWSARLKGVPLSPMEQKIYDLSQSMKIREVGSQLGIAPSTVRGTIARARAKLGIEL